MSLLGHTQAPPAGRLLGRGDIQSVISAPSAVGYPVQQDARDVGDGRHIAVVTDPDGNPIGLAPAL